MAGLVLNAAWYELIICFIMVAVMAGLLKCCCCCCLALGLHMIELRNSLWLRLASLGAPNSGLIILTARSSILLGPLWL